MTSSFRIISTDHLNIPNICWIFPLTFESFHGLLFEKGTYVFDPAKEMLVRLYPEQIFMDLGVRISKMVFFTSLVFIAIGIFLMVKSKKQKQ